MKDLETTEKSNKNDKKKFTKIVDKLSLNWKLVQQVFLAENEKRMKITSLE